MDSNLTLSIILPSSLAIIMLGMGLTLRVQDFRNVLHAPRVIWCGLIIQVLGLPLLAYGIARHNDISASLKMGLMVLAACPAGTLSNLMSYLAKGSVSLAVILTALTSLISVVTFPLIIHLASLEFMGAAQDFEFPVGSTMLQIALMVVLPVALGMLVRASHETWARRIEKPLKLFSLIFLLAVTLGIVIKEGANLKNYFIAAGVVTISLNVATLAMSGLASRVMRLPAIPSKTMLISTGMRNTSFGMAVASSPTLLNDATMAVPAAIYSTTMFLSIAMFMLWDRGQKTKEHELSGGKNLVME